MTNRLTQVPSRLLSTKDAAIFMLINDRDFNNEIHKSFIYHRFIT